MKTLYKSILKRYILNSIKIGLLSLIIVQVSCSNDGDCAYVSVVDCMDLDLNFGNACDSNNDGINNGTVNQFCECMDDTFVFDCEALELNIGDGCDSNNDGINNGTVNQSCECIPDFTVIGACPGFVQNGDFEMTTGDPNTIVDQDIDLATSWKALWQSGSLADLFDDNTTFYGAGCFTGPILLSGVYAGMWIENQNNGDAVATYREGMFNELTAVIHENTGIYTLSFDYANMSQRCGASNDVKVGVYGIYHPITDPLPANPVSVGTPSNIDLFGVSNTVFLGEVIVTAATTNTWVNATFTIDTSTLTLPTNGINHIMVSNSHLPFEDYGKMFLGFDNFCLIN